MAIQILTWTFLDPGRPLDETDRWNARQLANKLINDTTIRMMKPPEWKPLEELEAIGEKNNINRVVFAHIRFVHSK